MPKGKKDSPIPKGWVVWNRRLNGQASGPASFTSEAEAIDAKKAIVDAGIKGAKRDLDQLKETKRRIIFKDPRDEKNFQARVGMLEQTFTEKKLLSQDLIAMPLEEAKRRIKVMEEERSK